MSTSGMHRRPFEGRHLREYYSIETQSFQFFIKKTFEIDEIEFCPYLEKRNHLGFVDISPILVIDSSMENSSLVLQQGNPKI